ncbi:hypothetical protein OS493_006870 [Desmophyllum pertusum]|uniref:YqaJ viral recombinase domain-containing protein n=1 Tax=Desmophyllum pertusum TaxID=174260 RepID=A0A9W9ZSU1_9CNID|nr:hypothetical protein OS493_006870 [Desmophyllum pertusum]
MSPGKENTPITTVSSQQRCESWFRERIGKVTSSKAPALIGLQGKKEFIETWDCVLNKKPEPTKNFKNFQRGIKFESSAIECFKTDSGAEVKECGMFPLELDRRFGASPDSTFQGETCKALMYVKTGSRIALSGLCLLERYGSSSYGLRLQCLCKTNIIDVKLRVKLGGMDPRVRVSDWGVESRILSRRSSYSSVVVSVIQNMAAADKEKDLSPQQHHPTNQPLPPPEICKEKEMYEKSKAIIITF